MDLSSLGAAAGISKHAVVLLASGGVLAGYRAWYFAVKKDDARRLHAQFAVVVLAALGACAAYSVYYFTDEISLERERLAQVKEAELERFKVEKDSEIKSAIARAAEADVRAAEAVKGTRSLELEVAHQRERAARAEKDLVEIQERIKPRSFTDAQRSLLIKALTKSSKGAVRIGIILGDGEALIFARQIKEILKASGWTDVHLTHSIYTGTPVGLSVIVRDGNKPPMFAEALAEAFESTGVPVKREYNPELPQWLDVVRKLSSKSATRGGIHRNPHPQAPLEWRKRQGIE